ncbi:MAG: dihydroorotase family protein [Candidatus Levybacteria bacterium]|nr:dihydroorotase family protein [Candidatus Levybacteria bacterium]
MTITLPGLIDPHVHLRDPGQTEKEDFFTGTSAALAGGFTTVLDMPNNKTPITTAQRLEEKINVAREKIVCDVGFYFGSMGDNLEEFEKLTYPLSEFATNRASQGDESRSNGTMKQFNNGGSRHSSNNNLKVFGLKLYLNPTTGNYTLNHKPTLMRIFVEWTHNSPILFHAENETFDIVLNVLKEHPRPIHLCHLSTSYELKRVIEAKSQGLPVTCGVTPHHLFLTSEDEGRLGHLGQMKPPLQSREDIDFLWQHLDAIDVIESDHAPHTVDEKRSDPPAGGPHYGVPGLETTLPLLLTAVHEDKLLIDDVVRLCHTGPARCFHVSIHENTYAEVDLDEEWEISNDKLLTKCKWSPFNGWKVKGRVKRVFLRGEKVFEDRMVLAKPGSGKIISA